MFVKLRWEFVLFKRHVLFKPRVEFANFSITIAEFSWHCFKTIQPIFSLLFKDARSSDDGREILIDQQQDCITIARSSKDEIAFRRKFDTCDEDDFPFHEGTMFIYWMRGEEPLEFDESITTPDLPEMDSGMTHLQLLRADSISIPEK